MEDSSFKILILGAGAVGGYYGGKLAARYTDPKEVEVIFIARGGNKQALEDNGLRLITPRGEQQIVPVRVADDPEKAGVADLILCCLKTYDLDEGLRSVARCIKPGTIVLPLLTGLPDGATSSMENDFKRGGRTEMDSLTGYVVRLGKELGVDTPNYDKMLSALQKRSKS